MFRNGHATRGNLIGNQPQAISNNKCHQHFSGIIMMIIIFLILSFYLFIYLFNFILFYLFFFLGGIDLNELQFQVTVSCAADVFLFHSALRCLQVALKIIIT